MPNRVIKETIRTSESLNNLSDFEFRLWIGLLVSADDVKRAYNMDIIKNQVPNNPMEKNGYDLAGLMGSPFISRANVCISTDADHIMTDDIKVKQ